jgi:hypothetical protein
MQHEIEVILELEDNPFPEEPQTLYMAADRRLERRVDAPKEERPGERNPLERLADDARFERGEISRKVRQLRHSFTV